ncbi:MAG TPA: LicD family protein [Prolixibacteraceae bacterium]|nr:LicD family protein [Prolixibacteraceae bacterium]
MMHEDFSKYNGEGTILRNAQLRILEILVEVDRICTENDISYWLDYGTLLGAVRHRGFIPWDDDVDIAVPRKDYKRLCAILKEKLPANLTFQDETTDKRYFLKFAKVRDLHSFLDDPIMQNKGIKEHGLYIDIFPLEKLFSKNLKTFIEYIYGNAFKRYRKFYPGTSKYISGVILMPFAVCFIQLVRFFSWLIPTQRYYTGCGVPFYYRHTYHTRFIFPLTTIEFEGYRFKAPCNTDLYLKNIYGDYWKIPPEEKRITHADTIEIF